MRKQNGTPPPYPPPVNSPVRVQLPALPGGVVAVAERHERQAAALPPLSLKHFQTVLKRYSSFYRLALK